MLSKKKPTNPDRVGLSLHKHLTPHVLELSGALDMNPNEFVNACVEQCVEGMLQEKDPGPGSPPIVYRYRLQTGKDPQPISQRFNAEEYALLRGLEELLYDFNLAKECVLTGKTTGAILTPAILELVGKYRELRSQLIAGTKIPGNGSVYPAPQTGM
ncbi:MAG: hypothetical protein JNG82_06665 [Opitutaceae bacterium]|jgi:hypothetical protein|nr:hypothetical protein [Opitutaceae bacterium]